MMLIPSSILSLLVVSVPAHSLEPECLSKVDLVPVKNQLALARSQCLSDWAEARSLESAQLLTSEPIFQETKERMKLYASNNAPIRFDLGSGELFLSSGFVKLSSPGVPDASLVAATDYRVSPDGTKFLFTNNLTGDDAPEWKIFDIPSRKVLSDAPLRIRWSHIKWNETSDGVYYTRWPSRDVEEIWRDLGVRRNVPLAFHQIGDSSDAILFDTPERKTSMIFSALKPAQENTLFVYRQFGSGVATPMYWGEKVNGRYHWTLIQGSDNPKKSGSLVGRVGNEAVFKTAECGNSYCLIAIQLAPPFQRRLFLPYEPKLVLDAATFVGPYLLTTFIDQKSLTYRFRIYDRNGKLKKEIVPQELNLPLLGTFSGFSGNLLSERTYFSYSSANFPPVTFRLDLETLKVQKLSPAQKHPFENAPVQVRQASYRSLDGQMIPIHIYSRTDLNHEPNFAFLFYYGALGANYLPSYSTRFMAALEAGGIVAVANVRGGGERGYEWYRSAGINKSLTIMDIAGASRWLKRNFKIKNNTVIPEGSSWGGLHTYLALIKYPQDFAGFISGLPVASLPYSFQSSLFGWLIPDDMFFPRNKSGEHLHFSKYLKYAEQWSALEQVSQMKEIKPVLTLNVRNDERVGPESGRIMTAALRRQFGEDAPVYLVETPFGGHSSGAFIAHEIAFIAKLSGVKKLEPMKTTAP
ncbi:MAG: prolyl oligopeptidase family serine peptidase [Bdellovibrionales bacterium]|nr:prolyl oligopeptidase family serine peptidase [Bdellovibrionales bacterium]